MSDDVLKRDLHDMDQAVYRIAYVGEQTKPVRGVAFATTQDLLAATAAAAETAPLGEDEALPPETCLVGELEMRTVVTRTEATWLTEGRSEGRPHPFFRVSIARTLRDATSLAGTAEVTRDRAAKFLQGIDRALDAGNHRAKGAIARLRRETLPE